MHPYLEMGSEGLPYQLYLYSKIHNPVGSCAFIVRIGITLNFLVLGWVGVVQLIYDQHYDIFTFSVELLVFTLNFFLLFCFL